MIFITACSFIIGKMQGWDLPYKFRHMPLRAKEWLFNAIPNVNIPTGMQIQQRNLLRYIAIIFTSVSENHASVWFDTVICYFGALLHNQQHQQFFLRLLSCWIWHGKNLLDLLRLFLIYTPQNKLTQNLLEYFPDLFLNNLYFKL